MSRYSLVAAILIASTIQAMADEDQMAREAKAADIASAKDAVDTCEQALKWAIKNKDQENAKKLRAELNAAKAKLAATKRKKHEDYVASAAWSEQKRQEDESSERELAAERREKRLREAEATQRAREEKAKAGPVFIESAVIGRSIIGLPELNFVVSNAAGVTVEAFDIEVECFNSFDEPVKNLVGSNVFTGAVSTPILPNGQGIYSVQLSLHGGTSNAMVRVTRAKLSNGEVWKQSRDEAKEKPGAIYQAKPPRR
jgi:hypothetical protein